MDLLHFCSVLSASAMRTVRASVDVIVFTNYYLMTNYSGADRYPDPSEALLLSGNVTGSEPASCICIVAAESRSDCVRGVGLAPYACSC